MRLTRALVISSLAALLVGCSNADQKKVPSTALLQQEWFPFSGFAGEVIPLDTTDGRFLRIAVRSGSETINPIQEVLNGRAAFGVVSADKLLQARDGGLDVVAIGVINAESPTVFLSLKESGITDPKHFVGRRIGILEGTNTEYIYRLMMKRAGIERARVKEANVPFDLGTFLLRRYDVRPAFAYDEPITLDLAKRAYNLIRPADFQVRFLGTVYFTTGQRIATDSAYVQRFVNTVAQGWTEAMARPDSAVRILRRLDAGLDTTKELAALRSGTRYFTGVDGKVLTAREEDWLSTESGLRELGIISKKDLGVYWDRRFIDGFHRSAVPR